MTTLIRLLMGKIQNGNGFILFSQHRPSFSPCIRLHLRLSRQSTNYCRKKNARTEINYPNPNSLQSAEEKKIYTMFNVYFIVIYIALSNKHRELKLSARGRGGVKKIYFFISYRWNAICIQCTVIF